MKYIRWMIFLALAAAIELPLWAQSSYVAVTSGVGVPAAARATESDATDPVLTIKKRVDEVNVLFIATDRHGKFVRNLRQNDFSILDDHKPPQSIVNFRRDTDLPLELGLLIDTSGSVRSRFDFEEEAAVGFLQHTLRPRFDRAFVMGFNGHSQIAQDFTDNVQLLETGVRSLRNGGGTALYDAIYRASRNKLLKDKSDRPVRHAIIILSDGEDNQSDVNRGLFFCTPISGLFLLWQLVLLNRRHRKLGFVIADEDRDQPCRIFAAHICEYFVHPVWGFIKILTSAVDRLRISFDLVAERAGGNMPDHCAGMAVRRRRFARRYFDVADKHAEVIAIHGGKLMRIGLLACWSH